MQVSTSESPILMEDASTSDSSCLISIVICFMMIRGANSDNRVMKVETDFGPLVSLLLNSLLLKSLA